MKAVTDKIQSVSEWKSASVHKESMLPFTCLQDKPSNARKRNSSLGATVRYKLQGLKKKKKTKNNMSWNTEV